MPDGKGKLVDLLCEDINVVTSCQEDNNAGQNVQTQRHYTTPLLTMSRLVSNMTSTYCQVGDLGLGGMGVPDR